MIFVSTPSALAQPKQGNSCNICGLFVSTPGALAQYKQGNLFDICGWFVSTPGALAQYKQGNCLIYVAGLFPHLMIKPLFAGKDYSWNRFCSISFFY